MPSDEYTSASGGGALRLKGARVEKHKSKKHKKKKSIRDKEASRARNADDALERTGSGAGSGDEDRDRKTKSKTKDKAGDDGGSGNEDYDDYEDLKNDPYARMTPAERRFAEAQDKKVSSVCF